MKLYLFYDFEEGEWAISTNKPTIRNNEVERDMGPLSPMRESVPTLTGNKYKNYYVTVCESFARTALKKFGIDEDDFAFDEYVEFDTV